MLCRDLPHHVTQRGNRREPVFFEADDYRLYRRLVAAAARRAGAAVWAYCLMPNHVHLIVTPADADGLRATFAEAHRRYTGAINARFRWTGHLFQGRFGAVVMDEPHLLAAARYIALNPVVAGLVSRAEDWPWSSTRAQLAGEDVRARNGGAVRALASRFCGASRHAGGRGDDDPDRAGARDRPPAREAGMDRDARAPARPPFGSPANPAQSREWSETPHGRRSCCESHKVNCHRNPVTAIPS